MSGKDLLVTGIGELVTPEGKAALRGERMREIRRIQDAFVAIDGGRIVSLGPREEAPKDWKGDVLDAGGRLVTPG
ncbi:imidazolonepropionase, partial [Candidatus Bipolaricaulota bacterium]|nr:imidazolonepropionase [Candidatus Bipolaricaulota bacterium]